MQCTVPTQQQDPLKICHHWNMVSYVTTNLFRADSFRAILLKIARQQTRPKLRPLGLQDEAIPNSSVSVGDEPDSDFTGYPVTVECLLPYIRFMLNTGYPTVKDK